MSLMGLPKPTWGQVASNDLTAVNMKVLKDHVQSTKDRGKIYDKSWEMVSGILVSI